MQSLDKILAAFPENHVIHRCVIERIAAERKPYVVFLIARSGSTWLTDMASRSGKLGVPQEWFNEEWIQTNEIALGCCPPKALGISDVDQYILKTAELTASEDGCFGIQLSPSQANNVCQMLEDVGHACSVFSHFYLRRRNVVRQAISLYRSVQSGLFHSYQTDEGARGRFDSVEYDNEGIKSWCRHLVEGEIYFERIFALNGIRPERLLYEDLVADPLAQLRRIYKCVNADGGSINSTKFELRVLSDNRNESWERKFRDESADFLLELDQYRPAI
ncbi:Stf0 family sulfotransferase [Burkholderia vietnamiensis]|uniref:Stf0 family sulfotransferase n=1 Tax=Burkholderia vietnamiensis TaxID=60552 RepID=UPI0009B95936|nr:Stf0 family sulfotransferase [Burkholderia vietnamiensis]MBR8358470.1 hypothetical protein [Burkholderia vietnamiensis]CAG9213468.1 LPS sulfotransferase NodH [Burkholderia vietnamiensis]HDR9190705.1 hypothetical protein [Burkholderia vietnamiensis]